MRKGTSFIVQSPTLCGAAMNGFLNPTIIFLEFMDTLLDFFSTAGFGIGVVSHTRHRIVPSGVDWTVTRHPTECLLVAQWQEAAVELQSECPF